MAKPIRIWTGTEWVEVAPLAPSLSGIATTAEIVAIENALDLKAPLASPTFTGNASFNTALFTDGTTSEGRITSAGDTFYVQAGVSTSDTTAKLNIARRSTTATNISQLNAFADTTTFHGNIVRGTGGHPGTVSTNVFHGIAQPYATALPPAADYAEGTIIVRWV